MLAKKLLLESFEAILMHWVLLSFQHYGYVMLDLFILFGWVFHKFFGQSSRVVGASFMFMLIGMLLAMLIGRLIGLFFAMLLIGRLISFFLSMPLSIP